MKLKKDVVQPAQPTTNEVVKGALTALNKDVTLLDTRRQSALSVFRQTADSLFAINTQLNEKIATMDEIIKSIEVERENASKMVLDNDAVRSKIIDIIGA